MDKRYGSVHQGWGGVDAVADNRKTGWDTRAVTCAVSHTVRGRAIAPVSYNQFVAFWGNLAKSHPECAVVPVFLQGLGKALPKGETVPVPFNCTVIVGEEMLLADNADAFVAQ